MEFGEKIVANWGKMKVGRKNSCKKNSNPLNKAIRKTRKMQLKIRYIFFFYSWNPLS
jgi:hypothetical protein